MTFSRGDVPEHLTIRITQQSDPVSAVTEDDAWRALDAYPRVVVLGPVFGVAERPVRPGPDDAAPPSGAAPQDGSDGHWRVLSLGDPAPQGARDALGGHLRRRAKGSRDR